MRRDPDGRLVFPRTDEVPGVYRLRLRGTATERHYVGGTDRLRSRCQHYRTPGSGQPTIRRINGLLVEYPEAGREADVDVAEDDIEVSSDGVGVRVDLGDKAMRRLLESAGVLAAAGHGMLNR